MKISNNKTVDSLQKEFQDYFPHLKIEFYEETPEMEIPGQPKSPLKPEIQLAEIRTNPIAGYVAIDGESTIGDFEQLLKRIYGLNVQVFRQSGNLWLQTSTTDHWTLAEANRKGAHSILEYNKRHNE